MVAYAFIVLGALNVALGGWLTLLQRFSFSLVIGFILLALAALYLTRPYFIVEKNQIAVAALIGPLTRTYFFQSPDDVKVDGSNLYVRDATLWKRVPVRRFMSNPADWKALENRFAAGTTAQTA